MKNKLSIIKSFLILFLIISCNKDDGAITTDFVVAFENPSVSFEAADTEKDISLIFSRPATENSTIRIKYNATNADYGSDKDFTTVPAADSQGVITINVKSGDTGAAFKFNKLKNPIEGENKSVTFDITKVDAPLGKIQGNVNLQVSFTETASLGSSLAPEVGGPNEPNQVYIDLSSEKSTIVKRDTWDFGFYSGDDYRVVINGSIYMAVKELDATDIDAVKPEDVVDDQELIRIGAQGSQVYVDNPSGNISETAIKEIVVTEADNKVYLVNAGFKVGTQTPNVGSVAISGDSRGWKKIRIVRDGDNYKLLYANLDETTHKEAVISKKSGYNFNFFSLDTEGEVNVEPEASKWDLNFSVFTNVIPGFGAYGYSDFVSHNRKGGVTAYMVEDETDGAYDNFNLSNVNNASFSANQTAIGSNWRSVFRGGSIKSGRFFIIKDADDNIYKIKFTALVNESGERGHPKFEYALLQ